MIAAGPDVRDNGRRHGPRHASSADRDRLDKGRGKRCRPLRSCVRARGGRRADHAQHRAPAARRGREFSGVARCDPRRAQLRAVRELHHRGRPRRPRIHGGAHAEGAGGRARVRRLRLAGLDQVRPAVGVAAGRRRRRPQLQSAQPRQPVRVAHARSPQVDRRGRRDRLRERALRECAVGGGSGETPRAVARHRCRDSGRRRRGSRNRIRAGVVGLRWRTAALRAVTGRNCARRTSMYA